MLLYIELPTLLGAKHQGQIYNILVRRNETLFEIGLIRVFLFLETCSCYYCDLFAESSNCCELKNINKIEETLSIYHEGGCVHM